MDNQKIASHGDYEDCKKFRTNFIVVKAERGSVKHVSQLRARNEEGAMVVWEWKTRDLHLIMGPWRVIFNYGG